MWPRFVSCHGLSRHAQSFSCSATLLPNTHFMSHRVRSSPRPCDMLPLFIAIKPVSVHRDRHARNPPPRTHRERTSSLDLSWTHEQRAQRPCGSLGREFSPERDEVQNSRTSQRTERDADTTRRPLLSTSRLTSSVPKLRDG